jgi:hypothetical protein
VTVVTPWRGPRAYRTMPFTFFAHQVPVLPLKWLKPRWFDGTALCIGSMAPDFAYAFVGTRFAFGSHNLRALLFWTLPFTLLATHCVRRYLAPALGSQLPEPLGGEVRALALSKHRLWISASSALLGGLSHVFIDGFTHAHGWAAIRYETLRQHVYADLMLANLLQYIGHTIGTSLGVAMFMALISTRRISAWNRSRPTESADAESRFWPLVGGGALLCIPAGSTALLTGGGVSVAIIRACWVLSGALLFAAVRDRRRSFARSPLG